LKRPKNQRRGRRGRLLLGGAVVLPLALVGVAYPLMRDPLPGILARRGELAEAVEEPGQAVEGFVDRDVRLVSTSGLEVELTIRRPVEAGDEGVDRDETPRPAFLLLGGHRTGRDAARLVQDSRGCVVAAMSYPTDVRKIHGPGDVLAARRAIPDTVSAVMLCFDYLAAQPFVNEARVELVGVSLGAPFVCIAGAVDPRFRRVWAMHGGGDVYGLLEHALKREIHSGLARKLAAAAITPLAHGLTLAPEDWVGGIAPRPFVMVNGREDVAIPRASIDTLFEAAGEPKELLWLEGGHIEKRDEQQVRELCDLVLDRMQ
jgi:dienelactone hydrolase